MIDNNIDWCVESTEETQCFEIMFSFLLPTLFDKDKLLIQYTRIWSLRCSSQDIFFVKKRNWKYVVT